ncbi:hypothetical protein GQ53DRAFT_847992 [Thozetella sp. PMI_491]|nr:hypothetical protein GQ53DRAFT_847992 [Thozetella sp. PMI_491]
MTASIQGQGPTNVGPSPPSQEPTPSPVPASVPESLQKLVELPETPPSERVSMRVERQNTVKDDSKEMYTSLETPCTTKSDSCYKTYTREDSDLSRRESESVEQEGAARPSFAAIWRPWVWECLACYLSIVTLIGIVIVLKTYDNHALPSLPMNLSLNALLAFLTTFSKALLMIPVAESIGQWKWSWFSKKRPLLDYQTFEYGSRGGVWGRLQLLATTRWRHIVTIGPIVSILGVVASPITQQILTYPSRMAATDAVATTTAAWSFQGINPGGPNVPLETWVNGEGALFQGISSVNSSGEHLPPVCPTARCTYPDFQTLAVCAKVANITSLLNVTMVTNSSDFDWIEWTDAEYPNMPAFNISLPQPGVFFLTPVGRTVVIATINNTFSFGDDKDLMSTGMSNLVVFYARDDNLPYPPRPDSPPPRFEAVEIFYHLCVNQMHLEVNSAQPSTTITASSYKVLNGSGILEHQFFCTPSSPDIPYQLAYKGNCQQRWRGSASNSLVLEGPPVDRGAVSPVLTAGNYSSLDQARVWFSEIFWTDLQLLWSGNTVDTYHLGSPLLAGYRFIQSALGVPEDTPNVSQVRYDRLVAASQEIAIGATNTIRTFPDFTNATASTFTINGTAWSEETYVYVRWGWLSILVIQVFVGTLFFVATVTLTGGSGTPTLKNSPLAAMLAIRPQDRIMLGSIGKISEMDSRAQKFNAVFVKDELQVWKV